MLLDLSGHFLADISVATQPLADLGWCDMGCFCEGGFVASKTPVYESLKVLYAQ